MYWWEKLSNYLDHFRPICLAVALLVQSVQTRAAAIYDTVSPLCWQYWVPYYDSNVAWNNTEIFIEGKLPENIRSPFLRVQEEINSLGEDVNINDPYIVSSILWILESFFEDILELQSYYSKWETIPTLESYIVFYRENRKSDEDAKIAFDKEISRIEIVYKNKIASANPSERAFFALIQDNPPKSYYDFLNIVLNSSDEDIKWILRDLYDIAQWLGSSRLFLDYNSSRELISYSKEEQATKGEDWEYRFRESFYESLSQIWVLKEGNIDSSRFVRALKNYIEDSTPSLSLEEFLTLPDCSPNGIDISRLTQQFVDTWRQRYKDWESQNRNESYIYIADNWDGIVYTQLHLLRYWVSTEKVLSNIETILQNIPNDDENNVSNPYYSYNTFLMYWRLYWALTEEHWYSQNPRLIDYKERWDNIVQKIRARANEYLRKSKKKEGTGG